MTLVVRTPFGRPVAWAEVSLTGDIGDGDAQNDTDCLVVSGRRLGRTANPFDDFLLCLVAEGVTGRASQLALAAFVESFLASDEVDLLWRLRGGVRAADARLATSEEGRLSSTITALFLAGDGTAYGASVGDSPLLVFPRHQEVGGHGGGKMLGHESGTALGTGELDSAGGEGIVEHWWPDLAGDGTRTRLEPGTSLLVSCRDNRQRITLRFDGGQVLTSGLVAQAGWLVSVVGSFGGPSPGATGEFGLVCLAEGGASSVVAGFLRGALELDPGEVALCSHHGLDRSFKVAGGDFHWTRLAVAAMGARGPTTTFASAGASAEPATTHSRANEDNSNLRLFTLRLGSGSDPLDRGILIAFDERTAPMASCAPVTGRRTGWVALQRWLNELAKRGGGGRHLRRRF